MTRDASQMETTAVNNEMIGELGDARPANLNLTPSVLLQNKKLRDGGRIVIHVLSSCYCFLMLAIICDEYFIGSIEILCSRKTPIRGDYVRHNEFPVGIVSDFNMKSDFMGTFMTIATSFPELVVSCVGTFVTEGDIGVGTIVGSAVFNILAVPALCGLFTRTTIQLDRWWVTRDCIFYSFSIFALVAVIYDKLIMWYEAACLIAFYGVYLASNFTSFRNQSQHEKNLFPHSRHVQKRNDVGGSESIY